MKKTTNTERAKSAAKTRKHTRSMRAEHSRSATVGRPRARSQRGASLLFIIACAVLLGFLIFAGFNYAMMMGGSRQVRNSVDASVLNIAKLSALASKVQTNAAYKDCADSQGLIGMSNINRVWGKALLINANVEAMEKEGLSTAAATGGAETAYNMAQILNDRLFEKVTDNGTLASYFQDLAANRTSPMLGGGNLNQQQDSTFPFAMIDRGGTSNLKYTPQQIPKGVSVLNTGEYLQGYSTFETNKRKFTFTSFAEGEMPHLISDTYFASNRPEVAPFTGNNPIPNAFGGTGVIDGMRGSLMATASAAANPQRTFTLAIPQSYVLLTFQNNVKWYVAGKVVNVTSYDLEPKHHEWGVKEKPIPKKDQVINGFADIGNETNQPGLLQVLNAVPGDHDTALQKMLQRLQEIKSDFQMTDLKQLLAKQSVINSKVFYIYPDYKSPDFTNPTIRIAAANSKNLPSWLTKVGPPGTGADGTDSKVVIENKLPRDQPNSSSVDVIEGPQNPKPETYTELSGAIWWKPGTGSNQCLGEMRVARLCDVYYVEVPE